MSQIPDKFYLSKKADGNWLVDTEHHCSSDVEYTRTDIVEAQTRWIPISERLPQESSDLDILDAERNIHSGELIYGVFMKHVKGEIRMQKFDVLVTHWKYAVPFPPAPPVEQGEADAGN